MDMVAGSGGGEHWIWKEGWPQPGEWEKGNGGGVVVNGEQGGDLPQV